MSSFIYLKPKTDNLKLGFTLVELLVVMAILGILIIATLGNFRTSQIKARDAQRKSDLRQIVNALEAFMNDHGGYPPANSVNGRIKACGCGSGDLDCEWDQDPGQREFCDENSTVYIIKVPGDPTGDPAYCYWSGGTSFKLYAKIENSKDPEILTGGARSCGGENAYNFGISSSNTQP